jgi:hypothetical protein
MSGSRGQRSTAILAFTVSIIMKVSRPPCTSGT